MVRGFLVFLRDEASAAFSSIMLPHYSLLISASLRLDSFLVLFAQLFASFSSISYCSLSVVRASVNVCKQFYGKCFRPL